MILETLADLTFSDASSGEGPHVTVLGLWVRNALLHIGMGMVARMCEPLNASRPLQVTYIAFGAYAALQIAQTIRAPLDPIIVADGIFDTLCPILGYFIARHVEAKRLAA